MSTVMSTAEREQHRRRSGRWEGPSEAEKAQKLLDSIEAAKLAVEAQEEADLQYGVRLAEKRLAAAEDVADGRFEVYAQARDEAEQALLGALDACQKAAAAREHALSAWDRALHLGLPVPTRPSPSGFGRIVQELTIASRFV
jgi:hypothetical protein